MRSYTLLEMLITIFIGTIIIFVFAMLLDFTVKTNEHVTKDESVEDAAYIFNYLTNEIKGAEKVHRAGVKPAHRSYQNSLAFILEQRDGKDNYKYSYFSLKDGNLYRITQNSKESNINSDKVNFQSSANIGINSIADSIEDMVASYDEAGQLIEVEISFSSGQKFQTSIYCNGG